MKKNLPRALIMALADKNKEARLRSICHRLKEKGKTVDYSTGEVIPYLDLLMYGVGGTKFSVINQLFDKEK